MTGTQIGIRVDPVLWSNYKKLCSVEAMRPNELIETVMKTTVELGNVKSAIARFSIISEAQQLADNVSIRKRLLEIDNQVDLGYFLNVQWSNHDPANGEPEPPQPDLAERIERMIDQLLQTLVRTKNPQLVQQSEKTIDRALCYIRDIERPTDADGDNQSTYSNQAWKENQDKYATLQKQKHAFKNGTENSKHSRG